MNCKYKFFAALLVASQILGLSPTAYAVCNGATVQGGNYCLYHADISSLGGDLQSNANKILASNMYPYQNRGTQDDNKHYHEIATGYLNIGKAFRQNILLFSDSWSQNFSCPGTTLKEHLFCDPKKNYETEGFVDTDGDNDGEPDGCWLTGSVAQQLISARDTFAYHLSIGYFPQGSSLAETKTKLLDAIKTLANIYLMVADEFLIDGLEFRISYDASWKLDEKLAAQILLLQQAGFCYAEGVNSFVYGYSPAVGTNIYASDYFDDDVMSLFNLAVERWSVAWREQGAKERAKGMSPNPAETEAALQQFKQELRDIGARTYLLTASLANGQPDGAFPTNGGDRLKNALQRLRMLASTTGEHMNPLGYDDRHVPMRDFRNGLYDEARLMYQAAVTSYGAFQSTSRDFDFDLNSLLDATEQLASNQYKQQLAQQTGVSGNDPQFLSKVTAAGEDLYDCSPDLESADFDQCLQTKTKGYLGIKYTEIRKGRLGTNLALQKKRSLIEQVELENKRHNELLQIEHKLFSDRRDLLKNYLEDMKNARTIQKVKTKEKGKDTTTITTTSFALRNDSLGLDIDKELKLQELMRDYQIAQMQAADEVVIQNLLNQIAGAEIEIGLAIQNENSAVLDFENTLRQRNDLVFLLKKATEHLTFSINQLKDKASEVRMLRSEAALEYADDLNFAVHFAYLAAKRLEYEYLKPLVNVAIGPKTLNITDLYKVQTVEDLDDFLNKLQLYDTCAYGTRQPFRLEVELARNILGLTDEYLNPNGALTPSQVEQLRRQQVQLFIADHLLIDPSGMKYISFDFSTSLEDSYIAVYPVYNLKIWYGTAAPPCDPVLRSGVAIRFDTTQGSAVKPLVTLKQQGHSTFNNKNRNLVEYTPVNEYLNLQGVSTDNMFVTTGVLDTSAGVYINQDPPSSSLWNNAFKGRSVASSSWLMEVKEKEASTIDWGKVTNIIIHMDVLGTPY